MACQFIEDCPIFKQFSLAGLKNIWAIAYCNGSQLVNFRTFDM